MLIKWGKQDVHMWNVKKVIGLNYYFDQYGKVLKELAIQTHGHFPLISYPNSYEKHQNEKNMRVAFENMLPLK